MSMDPMKAKPGDSVKFANPNAGHDHDQEKARSAGLVVGQTYTLSKVRVRDWSTEVWLKGQEGAFNSVQFEEA